MIEITWIFAVFRHKNRIFLNQNNAPTKTNKNEGNSNEKNRNNNFIEIVRVGVIATTSIVATTKNDDSGGGGGDNETDDFCSQHLQCYDH